MREHWGALEADFQREYRIDLSKEIKTMSYRRFCVLKNNLSSNSVYVLKLGETIGVHHVPPISLSGKPKRVITDEKEAEKIFARWGN